MPKRHRVRARARRPVDAAPQLAERGPAPSTAPATGRERPERLRPRYRGAPPPPGGAHAIGAPSPILERAAAAERAYVLKDFGRLGKVVVAMLALLVASGFLVNALVK